MNLKSEPEIWYLGKTSSRGYCEGMSKLIYRFMDQQSWHAAKKAGVFEGSAVDKRDGFIHFSTAATVRETARLYYSDVQELILLSANAEDFGEALRWEPSRGGILFPHLYAPLQTALVRAAVLLKRTDNGHEFGPNIP